MSYALSEIRDRLKKKVVDEILAPGAGILDFAHPLPRSFRGILMMMMQKLLRKPVPLETQAMLLRVSKTLPTKLHAILSGKS